MSFPYYRLPQELRYMIIEAYLEDACSSDWPYRRIESIKDLLDTSAHFNEIECWIPVSGASRRLRSEDAAVMAIIKDFEAMDQYGLRSLFGDFPVGPWDLM